MQKTNFRFEAIVHDDASTDRTADIIREYAAKYPDIIKPIYETENQYSKRDGSLRRIMDAACTGKYIARCEGDDYWIDPFKLQKQVDFLEANPEHSLCFCAHQELFPDGRIKEVRRYQQSVDECSMNDIILGGGGFMATNTMFYRRSKSLEYPGWRKNAPVGDLPLMLLLSTKGKVGYIDEVMACYRLNSVGGWSYRMSNSFKIRRKHYINSKKMWKHFDEWTNYKYHSIINKKIKINNINYLKRNIKYLLKSILFKLK